MAESPRVGVVIPCYNSGPFLAGALESLDAQTFRDFEVLVIDDGSDKPETLKALQALGGETGLICQENRGLAAARNAGMAAVETEFLLPLDCDDRLEPEFLEKTVAALDARPEAAFAFTHLRLSGDMQGVLAKDYDYFTQLFLNQLPYCLLMRREAWERLGGYDETMRWGYEDWEFNIRLGAGGLHGVAVPEPLFRYRVGAAGMLQQVSRRLHAQLWRDIQVKNRDLYKLKALLDTRRRWRDGPRAYPAWKLFGLFAVHRLLPPFVFNRLFSGLLRFSASARAAGEGEP